jgi:hypothetical protein
MAVPHNSPNPSARPDCSRKPLAGIRGARALAAIALLTSVLAAPAAAHAEEAPPSSSSSSTASPLAPAPTVAITAPSDKQFVPSSSITVSGTKSAGSSVAVSVDGRAGCSTPASDQALTTWACVTALPNGPGITVTATETLEDATTSTSAVTVNVLGPPTINSTPPQQSPGVASGTGYPQSRIQLLANGTAQACTALVSPAGQWLCTIAGGPNTYTVSARQAQDWGTSDPSAAVNLVVNPAPVAAPPPPPPPPLAQPAPVLPPPPPVAPEAEVPSPTPPPPGQDRSDGGTLPWLDRPIFPGPGGKGPTIREALTNWGSPTGFGSSLPTPQEAVASGNWLWAPLVALGYIGLVAVPLRLLASTLRGRFGFRRPQLAGRNRGAVVADDAAPKNPWLVGLVPLAATAGLIVLANGIDGEVRYLRLLVAVGAGLTILNVAGVAIATRIAARSQGVSRRLRFLPMLLIIAAIATVLARSTGMEPPLVGGVLIAAGFALAVPVRQRALVSLSQVGGILLLAVLAWMAHHLVGSVDGFWASLLSETLATVCLAGLGSAVILMLPLGTLPGRVVLEWSPRVWCVVTLAVSTVAAAVLLGGGANPALPMLATLLVVSAFAAVCVAVWAWVNYVEVSKA